MAENRVKITISADGRDAEQAVGRLNKKLGTLEKDSKASAKGMRDLSASTASTVSQVKSLVLAYGGLQIARHVTETASSFELLGVSLDTLTKGHGQETLDALNQWAKNMPMDTQQAVNGYRTLRSMGLQPTIADMTTLVDASSALGGGVDAFDGIARALGQIHAKGKVSAEELMQLAERGIPAYEILQRQMGLTAAQVGNIGNESIDADKAIEALLKGMSERYAGQSQRIQDTWSGLWTNIGSQATEFERMMMESGPFQVMKAGLSDFVDYLNTVDGQIQLAGWAHDTSVVVVESFEVMTWAAQGFFLTIKGWQGIWNALQQSYYSGINEVYSLYTQIPGMSEILSLFGYDVAAIIEGNRAKIAELDQDFNRLSDSISGTNERFADIRKHLDSMAVAARTSMFAATNGIKTDIATLPPAAEQAASQIVTTNDAAAEEITDIAHQLAGDLDDVESGRLDTVSDLLDRRTQLEREAAQSVADAWSDAAQVREYASSISTDTDYGFGNSGSSSGYIVATAPSGASQSFAYGSGSGYSRAVAEAEAWARAQSDVQNLSYGSGSGTSGSSGPTSTTIEAYASDAGFTSLINSIDSYLLSQDRAGWGTSEYMAELVRVQTEIAELDTTRSDYQEAALELYQDQFDLLKNIEDLQEDEVDAQRRTASTLETVIGSVGTTISDLEAGYLTATGNGAAYYAREYASLLAGAMADDLGADELSAAVREYLAFVPDYVDQMQYFGRTQNEVLARTLADLHGLEADVGIGVIRAQLAAGDLFEIAPNSQIQAHIEDVFERADDWSPYQVDLWNEVVAQGDWSALELALWSDIVSKGTWTADELSLWGDVVSQGTWDADILHLWGDIVDQGTWTAETLTLWSDIVTKGTWSAEQLTLWGNIVSKGTWTADELSLWGDVVSQGTWDSVSLSLFGDALRLDALDPNWTPESIQWADLVDYNWAGLASNLGTDELETQLASLAEMMGISAPDAVNILKTSLANASAAASQAGGDIQGTYQPITDAAGNMTSMADSASINFGSIRDAFDQMVASLETIASSGSGTGGSGDIGGGGTVVATMTSSRHEYDAWGVEEYVEIWNTPEGVRMIVIGDGGWREYNERGDDKLSYGYFNQGSTPRSKNSWYPSGRSWSFDSGNTYYSAEGNIFSGPAKTWIAEAGNPEAAVPLTPKGVGAFTQGLGLDYGDLTRELRALRAEVAAMRKDSAKNGQFVKKTARQLERWDVAGMPEARE
jgi:tape measure domain-containing protein